MAGNSEFLDTPQDRDEKLDPQFDSATLSSGDSKGIEGDSKGVEKNLNPKSDSATPPSDNSHDVVPEDVDNDSDDPPSPPPGNFHDVVPEDVDDDSDDPPSPPPGNFHDGVPQDDDNNYPPYNPQDPFPMDLLNFIQPDNYLIRFIQEFDFQDYRYNRSRG